MILLLVDAPGMDPADQHPLGPDLVAEFEVLLQQLDLYYIKRPQWDRVVSILTLATLEAADTEKGRQAYERAVRKWRMSKHFDGSD